MRSDTRLLLQMCVGIWVCISNSAIFIFGILSPHLQSEPFSFSSADVNIIATVGAVASYFSLPVGMLYDRCGPRAVLLAGAAANLIGWLGIAVIFWAIQPTALPPLSPSASTTSAPNNNSNSPIAYLELSAAMEWMPPFYWICLFYGISQFSSPYYEQGAVLTNLQALSTHKGDVVLIQKTFMGLGSSIISQVYATYYLGPGGGGQSGTANDGPTTGESSAAYVADKHSMARFCLLIAAFSAIAGIVGGLFCQLPRPHHVGSDSPTVIEERSGGIQRRAAIVSRYIGSILRTPTSNRVQGLNNLPVSQSVVDGTPETEKESLKREVAGDQTSAEQNDNELDSKLSQKEMSIATILYGPFFFVARSLTFLIIVLVSAVTLVSSIVDPANVKAFEFQEVTVTTVIALCSVGFSIVVLLFKPKRSMEQLQTNERTKPNSDEDYQAVASTESEKEAFHKRSNSNASTSSGLSQRESRGDDRVSKSRRKRNTEETSKFVLKVEDPTGINDNANNQSTSPRSSCPSLLPTQRISVLDGNSHSLWDNLFKDPNHLFGLLAFRSLVVMGVTTTISANSSQIYYALDPAGYTDASNAAIVSVFGVANALGRVAMGLLDRSMQAQMHKENESPHRESSFLAPSLTTESTAHDCCPPFFSLLRLGSYGLAEANNNNINSNQPDEGTPNSCSKTVFNWLSARITLPLLSFVSGGRQYAKGWTVLHASLIPHLALLAAFPLFFIVPSWMLILPFALVGFATGTLWGGLILAVSHLYSPKHHGTHYGALSFAGMITPVVFNVLLFGLTYDKVLESKGLPLSARCAGIVCVQQPILWCLGVNVLGTIAAVLLCRLACRKGGM